jgi:hypothetical protein
MAYPISAAYQSALQASAQNIVTQAVLMDQGAPVPGLSPVPVISGSVTADITQQFYRSFDIQVADPTGQLTITLNNVVQALQPGTKPIDPYGMEIALYRGLVGWPLIPIGIFRITKVTVVDQPTTFHLEITGYDRSYTVAQQRWTDVYSIASGTVIDTAIQSLVSARFSFNINYVGFGFSTTTPLLTYGLDSSNNPWSTCQDLAKANGAVIYFDAAGNCNEVTPPIPGVAITPVFSFIEGPTCTMTSLEVDWATENISNDVIVLGEGTGIATPFYGRASVVNPNNPMNINGEYGDCPQIIISNLATSTTIAQTMAQTQLNINTGLTQSIQLECIPAPQLDVYDVIYVQRERSLGAAPYIINRITCPLEPTSTMQITAQLSEFLS